MHRFLNSRVSEVDQLVSGGGRYCIMLYAIPVGWLMDKGIDDAPCAIRQSFSIYPKRSPLFLDLPSTGCFVRLCVMPTDIE